MDGVLASCYASIDHNLGHIGMTPMRWFPGIMEYVFGNSEGTSAFISLAEKVGHLVLPNTVLWV